MNMKLPLAMCGALALAGCMGPPPPVMSAPPVVVAPAPVIVAPRPAPVYRPGCPVGFRRDAYGECRRAPPPAWGGRQDCMTRVNAWGDRRTVCRTY